MSENRPASHVPRPASLQNLVVAAVAFAVAAVFVSRFVLIELNVRRLGAPVALALAGAVAILGAGRGAQLLVHRLLRSRESDRPRIRVDFLAGYPLFGAICFLVGLVSTSRWTMAALLVLGLIGGTIALRSYVGGGRVHSFELSALTFAALGVVVAAVAIGLLNAQLPAVTLDEVAYHLATPRIWVNEGRVVDLPLLSHSYFPFGLESADLPLLALLGTDGAIASHFLHLFAAIAAGLTTFTWLRKRIDAGPALIGTAAILTTPALLVTTGWSWNEWPLVGICVALLWALDQEEPSHGSVAALVAAGLMTKYSFPLFALAVLLARRDRSLLRPSLIGAVLGSVFFIRNLVLTGNPVAPLLGPLAPDVAAYRNSFADYIFDGAFLDESLGIAAIALAAAALLRLPREAFLRNAAILLAIVTAVVALGRPSSRLLLPFLIPLAMIGWTRLAHGRVGWIATAVALLQLFLASAYISRLRPFELLAGRASDIEYAMSQRQPLKAILWADQRLPASSRALVLGANELYWFSKPVRGGGNFDQNRISHYLGSDLPNRLRRDRITHVVVIGDGLRVGSAPESKREQERTTTLTPEAAIKLRELLTRQATLIVAEGNRAIYSLKH